MNTLAIKKAAMSASELAAYAAGAGAGGYGGYALYDLLSENKSKAGALLASLFGAGIGTAGTHAIMNRPLSDTTTATVRDAFRGTANDIIREEEAAKLIPAPSNITQKDIDAIDHYEEPKDPIHIRTYEAFKKYPYAFTVPAGVAGGLAAGNAWGNEAVKRVYSPAAPGVPESWNTAFAKKHLSKPSTVQVLGGPTKITPPTLGPELLKAMKKRRLVGGGVAGTTLGLLTAGLVAHDQYKRNRPRRVY